MEDLEHYFNQHYLYSMLDIELKINYLQFQVNQALDEGNEALFNYSTSRLNDISDLLGILNEANQPI
jgi:hypothetical protein